MSQEPVAPEHYTRAYFTEACGGGEFFRAYGARIVKPPLAYALKRAALAPGMKVLDVGCGRGELLYKAREAGAWAAGTDFAPEALKLAREVSSCPVLRCDAKSLPFAARSFDRVFLLGVIDHLHDWELELCLEEVARVLKPGGQLLIHTCANRHYHKNLTYALRKATAALLGRPAPAPPRSAEDCVLHVNEHSWKGLERFLRRLGWTAKVEPMPNYKLLLRELYGELPADFPLKNAPRWRALLYRALIFRGPLKDVLARELFALASPPVL